MEREWRVIRRRGSAQELHDRAVEERIDGRAVVLNEVVAPALVLGSAQDAAAVDARTLAASGLELARRRSGGGAVLLGDGDHVWIDLVVPSGDPLADDDVERATWWVGRGWAASLRVSARIGDPASGEERVLSASRVHGRGVTDRTAGRIACFAAVGPGEVVLDGRKVVGISQRRTRRGARFQCVAYRRWDPRPLIDLLVPARDGTEAAAATGAGGAEWGGSDAGARIRRALRDGAGAVIGPDWDVERDLLPHLP